MRFEVEVGSVLTIDTKNSLYGRRGLETCVHDSSSNRHEAASRSSHTLHPRPGENFSIQIVPKNLLTPIAPAHQMINSPFVLNSQQLARHRQVLIQTRTCVNSED